MVKYTVDYVKYVLWRQKRRPARTAEQRGREPPPSPLWGEGRVRGPASGQPFAPTLTPALSLEGRGRARAYFDAGTESASQSRPRSRSRAGVGYPVRGSQPE